MDLLPHDILRTIVEDYLESDLRTLRRLDSAMCNHEHRPMWLSTLAQVTVAGFEIDVCNELSGCLLWLANRQVMVSPLFVDPSQIATATKAFTTVVTRA